MKRPFLTCEWRNLFLATYAVPPALLQPHVPASLELDTRDGNAFVSLVAFEFLNMRFRGIPCWGYRRFPELNLRFYVRHGSDRGVIFLREWVRPRLIAWVARAVYNEPYRVAPLTYSCHDDAAGRSMEYRLTYGGREHVLRICGSKPAFRPDPGSDEHFFKEHSWGFGRTRPGVGLRYEVAHPVWDVFPVQSYRVDLDWGRVYGHEWEALSKATPVSTVFAVGSAVAVYPKMPLDG